MFVVSKSVPAVQPDLPFQALISLGLLVEYE